MSFSETEETKQWAAKRFGIEPEDVDWYHSGICYDRIGVLSKEAADKVTAIARKSTANGGYFHGMPLGGQSYLKKGPEREKDIWDVMC